MATDNTITIELFTGSSWDKISLPTSDSNGNPTTIQTLLDKHGNAQPGGFIPESSRFIVGESVVDRNHQLNSEDQVSFSQPNKVGGIK